MFTRLSWCACFILAILSATATVDINLSEMQYISNHLTSDECRRLVSALYLRRNINKRNIKRYAAKNLQDEPCLRLLMHWNAGLDGGSGQTHTVLSQKLRQIKRKDLADWLATTSAQQLAEDLKDKAWMDPFNKDVRDSERRRDTREAEEDSCDGAGNVTTPTSTPPSANGSFFNKLVDKNDENFPWNLLETLGFALLVLILFGVVCIICIFCHAGPGHTGKAGCQCGLAGGSGATRSKQGGGQDMEMKDMGQTAAAKKKEEEKKKKKKNKSIKSMLCKTVEYRADGSVDETHLLLSDASETDFDRALTIMTSSQQPEPPPRNGRRSGTDDGRSQDYQQTRDIEGGRTFGNKRRANGEGRPENCDERPGRDPRRQGNDEGRRASVDRRQGNYERQLYGDDRGRADDRSDCGRRNEVKWEGDPALDPCWTCNRE